jgi:hypothetical protein
VLVGPVQDHLPAGLHAERIERARVQADRIPQIIIANA